MCPQRAASSFTLTSSRWFSPDLTSRLRGDGRDEQEKNENEDEAEESCNIAPLGCEDIDPQLHSCVRPRHIADNIRAEFLLVSLLKYL
jgi:hypothetical protein